MELSTIIRPNILALAPYSCARDEFKGEASVYVDANENPYNNGVNRYPEPLQPEVKRLLAPLKGVREEQIFLGNGSDEAIDLVYRIFCRPGTDNVVAISPSYGMYKVCADVNDIEYRAVPLIKSKVESVECKDYQIDREGIRARVDSNTKVIWICSPNNPTGNAYEVEELEWFLRSFPQVIVVVDEAYIDFSSKPSMTTLLPKYPNLIVLQTMSKAWGQAAIRLGIAMANTDIIEYFNRVKYPYNVNLLTQQQAVKVLSNPQQMRAQVQEILSERARMEQALVTLPNVIKVYPSDANFLLVKVKDADASYRDLQQKGIIVRNRNRVELCQGCLRITVGTPQENDVILREL